MAVGTNQSKKNSLDRLTDHIDSLQDGFRKLSKVATLKDLGNQFVGVLQGMFTNATIDLVHQPSGSVTWGKIVHSGKPDAEKVLALSGWKTTLVCKMHVSGDNITIIQKLVDNSLIGLVISSKPPLSEYSEIDLISLRLFVLMFDNAYQDMLFRRNEKAMIFSLNHRILQLNSLIDTGIEVATLDLHASLHKLALQRAASLTNASKGTVRVTREGKMGEEYRFPEGSEFAQSINSGNLITTNFTFLTDTYTFELFDKESRNGILPFEDTDQLLLDALARQVHASLENRHLHEQALENQRIEQEMNVAASIQKKIMPVSLPSIDGYDVAGINIPSKSIGGDYYDCIPLADGRFALVIADVSGKGIPAALLVSSLHAYLSAYLEGSGTLVQLASKLNKVLFNASTADKFVTAFIALLTPATGEIECVNAGHNPGYILRQNRSIDELRIGGLPLGSFELDIPYDCQRTVLGKGDRLLLYTDGVTEAENEHQQLYENSTPLTDFLIKNSVAPPQEFNKQLIQDIRSFTGSAPQNDDITILCVQRNS
jgi:serine phosphatase RsbU (regulator of sigma subunit)